jgi:hypothetical protein
MGHFSFVFDNAALHTPSTRHFHKVYTCCMHITTFQREVSTDSRVWVMYITIIPVCKFKLEQFVIVKEVIKQEPIS